MDGMMDVFRKQTQDEDTISLQPRRFSLGVFGFLSLFFAIVMVLIALGYFGYASWLDRQNAARAKELESLNAVLTSAEAKKTFAQLAQIRNAQSLLARHLFTTKLFALVEERTTPQVQITSLQFDASKQEVNIEALAKDLLAVARQTVSFLKDNRVARAYFSQAQRTDQGAYTFGMVISLKRNALVDTAFSSQ